MRLREQGDAGNAVAVTETVDAKVEQCRTRRRDRVAQRRLDDGGAIEPGATEQVDQHVVAGEGHGHRLDQHVVVRNSQVRHRRLCGGCTAVVRLLEQG